MCARQRIVGQLMIEGRWFPNCCCVANFALLVELGFDMIWLGNTFVICLVAGKTFLWNSIELIINMTLGAISGLVRTGQSKLGNVVVKGDLIPVVIVVAGRAVVVVISVNVIWIEDFLKIALMTAEAFLRRAGINTADVAGRTIDRIMCAGKLETGESMIEFCGSPGGGGFVA